MFKKALESSIGTQVDMSGILSVSESAINQYLKRNPDMKKLFDERRLSNVGKSENVMFKLLDFDGYDKDPSSAARIRQSSAQFILKNLGKDQGWVEKQQIEHFDYPQSLGVKIIMPKDFKNGTGKGKRNISETNTQTRRSLSKDKRRED